MSKLPHVLVTGAGSGIGLACATHFAQQGWCVSWNVLTPENVRDAKSRIETLVAQLGSEAAARFQVLEGNVALDTDCRTMAEAAMARFGRLDALVNAAGITRFCDEADLEGIHAQDFHDIYAVNTIGTFQMARACANALKVTAQLPGNGTSAVVNLSSYAGIHGGGSSLAYGASKAGVNAVTLSLARALAPHVRVNAVCPALVAEGFVERLQPASYAQRAARQMERTPLKRVGQPAEIALSIYGIVTCSPLMTGELLQLDAGLHLVAR